MHAIRELPVGSKHLLAATLLALASGCSAGAAGPDEPSNTVSAPGASGANDNAAAAGEKAPGAAAPQAPTPVASLTLENEHTVEFYDFKVGALIIESGVAYQQPVLQAGGIQSPERLVDTWLKISNGRPAPSALLDLQTRLVTQGPQLDQQLQVDAIASKSAALAREPDFGGIQPRATQTTSSTLLAENVCNNGCCDYGWLSTFYECNNPHSYNWFLFNYGSTYSNSGGDIKHYSGMACAAVGTSTFRVDIGGRGGTWTVPEAHWKSYNWDAYCPWWGCYDDPAKTSVNTSTDQHLHTYCGGWSG